MHVFNMRKYVAVIGLLILTGQAKADSYCTKPTECKAGSKRMYEYGQEKTVCLAWKDDADRAALALLHLVLTEQGFCRVALCEVESLCDISEKPPTGIENALMIGYGTLEQNYCEHSMLDLVGSLIFTGRARRLHAAIARTAAVDASCFHPAFYYDTDKLKACHFEQPLVVYVPDSRNNNITTEDQILQNLNLTRIYITRAKITDRLNRGNTSFLFIDSELWSDERRVRVIDLPGSRWFDVEFLYSSKERLLNHAPVLLDNIKKYRPQPSILREILALEEKQTRETEQSLTAMMAATNFKQQNKDDFNMIAEPVKSLKETYTIVLFKCSQDNAWASKELWDHLNKTYYKITDITLTMLGEIKVKMHNYVDCLENKELSRAVKKMMDGRGMYGLLGVIAAGAGVAETARFATEKGISIASYDAQPPLAGPDYASLISSGPRVSDLVSALRQALAACNWARVALLSEDTPVAIAVADGLRANLNLREKQLPRNSVDLKDEIKKLKEEDARIFVLNAGEEGVTRAIKAGADLNMTHEAGYVWLARERPAQCPPLMALLAPRPADGLAHEANKWSITTPLTNALLTMMLGYTYLIHDFDKVRYDHHTNETLQRLREYLQKNLTTDHIIGYNLSFDRQGVRQPAFQLETYEASKASTAVCFTGGGSARKLTDGSRNCTHPMGDAFTPTFCLDLAMVLGTPVLLLGALVAVHWTIVRLRKARRRSKELLRAEACTALLQRQSGAAAALARCHVDRARLHLLGELGTGRHGRVWLAEIMGEGGAGKKRYVAAKEPHSGCAPVEESELLREAGTLAGLQHEHVLALVGVCVVDGPPLVLTEQALFGDLQGYLVRRRALCGTAHEEAAHVAAPALTRLAHEAALALAYLARRGLVHCDVRAANCLVDERRALKLADFGMARGLGTGEGAAEDEYLCRRRKLVPVRWMPPESLARGVFSPASDVWALGVLILELVTLGERPFGALSSLEVVALVKQGGHARLPASCSRDTRHLTLACWRRDPVARPSAADAAAWLADHTTALAPAPHLRTTLDSDDDSGFGETPPPDTIS